MRVVGRVGILSGPLQKLHSKIVHLTSSNPTFVSYVTRSPSSEIPAVFKQTHSVLRENEVILMKYFQN